MTWCLEAFHLALLFPMSSLVSGAPNMQQNLLITAPPTLQPTHCANVNLLRRQQCSYGQCGTECLAQGAFCCGPAGTLATSPYWVCDNGACITSVRGTTGVVDCFDPDNASGTTQSCIDLSATSSCNPTDRCFTCDSEAPWCHWETYIARDLPTLRWFSCAETRLPDTTFLAATITEHTSNTLPTSKSSRTSLHSITSSQPTMASTATNTTASSSANAHGGSLSTGAIVGVAIGGGIAVIGSITILAYCCLMRPKAVRTSPPELATTERPMVEPVEMAESRQHTLSELNSMTAYSPDSQPATPFSASEGRTHNFADVNTWNYGSAHERVEVPGKFGYVPHSPREMPVDPVNQRNDWVRDNDRPH